MSIALGPYTFDTRAGADSDTFLYTDPIATDATLPQNPNTSRRWCHDTNNTTSSNVGPTSGAGGSPDGYLYTEASSASANDVFILELDLNLDTVANENVVIKWKTNQRGNDNNTTCQLQSKEGAGIWVNRGSLFGGSGDPDKVNSGGVQIWSQRSIDISALGVSHATTRVRLVLTFPSGGSIFHNDYGIDEFEVAGDTATPAFQMAASANIAASGENTTVQLTAPSGKNTGDFDVGRIQDDENPADSVDITADNYTEMEWCIKAITANVSDDQIYDFRVTNAGVLLDTYTLTPKWTIGTAAPSTVVKDLLGGGIVPFAR